ncbi:MAG: zf-HC2 domain-containing protein [Oscillospiraceae bacterium]|nr:zf-HC2 domain-containing protein [Oscillospiraceae bacterium]
MDDCRFFEELISTSLDGELTETEERALSAHLQSCEHCRAYRHALLAITEAERDALPPPPRDLTENIMAAVRKAPAPRKKALILAFPRRAQALAAMAALVILAGWAGTRLLSPKGASESAAAGISPQTMRIAAAPAAAPAAGMEPAEEESADNRPMMVFDAAAPEAAMDAAPLPFLLIDADGSERAGADGSALWSLGEPTDAPVPERKPDYILRDTAGALLWQLWEEGDSVLFRENGDGLLRRAEAGSFWEALGELS